MPPKKPDPKVSCVCGFQVRVDPHAASRQVTCPSCRSTFDYVVTIDQVSHAPRLSLILPRSALKPEGESLALVPSAKVSEPAPEPVAEFREEPAPAPKPPPTPPPKSVTRISKKGAGKTIKAILARCECGEDFPVEDNGELTSVQSCPSCKRSYHVVFKIESGTRNKAAIIVPTKPIVRRDERVRTIPPKPSKAPVAEPADKGNEAACGTTNFFGASKKGRTRVTKVSRNTNVRKAKTPKEVPAGAQESPCACGETFIVRRRDVGQELTCAACGAKSLAVETRDPQTLAPVIRMKPV
jgi:hypothetical protein